MIEVRVINAKRLLVALVRLERAIKSGDSSAIGRKIAREGLSYIKRVTPTNKNSSGRLPGSRRGFPAFRDQWEVIEQLTIDTSYRGVIRNRALDSGGEVALASIEFGARPHIIRPRQAGGMLKWHEPAGKRRFLGRRSDLANEIDRIPGRPGRVVDVFDVDPSDERWVLAHRVRHPGNRPFRMVAETREHLRRVSTATLIQFKAKIEAIFGPLSIAP